MDLLIDLSTAHSVCFEDCEVFPFELEGTETTGGTAETGPARRVIEPFGPVASLAFEATNPRLLTSKSYSPQ